MAPLPAEAALFEHELALEARELAALLALLDAEHGILTRHDDEQLLGIAAEKAQRLAALERLGARRNQFLQKVGLRADHDGMLDWLGANPARQAAARAWDDLQLATRRAREVNDINGGLVASRMQRCQRQLAFLHAAASNDATYSPDGYARASSPQRTLGEA